MAKLKINMPGGSVVEKPLVICFQGSTNTYLVFDNEATGSMGLPIIAISKLTGSTLEKITDKAEWDSVKENLKTILAGNPMKYLPAPETPFSMSDDFYTQLTLPITSFEALKTAYKPEGNVGVEASPAVADIQQTVAEPEMPAMPSIEPIEANIPSTTSEATSSAVMPDIAPVMPEMPVAPEMPAAPAVESPVPVNAETNSFAAMPDIAPVMPEMPVAPAAESPAPVNVEANSFTAMPDVAPVMPEIPATPEMPAVPAVESPVPVNVEANSFTAMPDIASVMPEMPVAPEMPAVPAPETPFPTAVEENSFVAMPDIAPVMPDMPATSEMPTSTMAPQVNHISDAELQEIKNTFMKSCEAMVDALIEKITES